MFNFSNVTAANNTIDMISAINTDITGGWFIILLVISIFVIIFINQSYYHTKHALLMAGFISAIVVNMFWWAGMVPYYLFLVVNVLLVAFVLITFLTRE